MSGLVEKMGFQLAVRSVVNADAGVPFGGAAAFRCQAAAAVADGVTGELDGVAATVADLVFLLFLEGMMTVGDEQQEPAFEADVLHVG